MFSEHEINDMRSQLMALEGDFQIYSEEEHLLVEQIRTTLRNLIGQFGACASVAIVAMCLEISLHRAYEQRKEAGLVAEGSSPFN